MNERSLRLIRTAAKLSSAPAAVALRKRDAFAHALEMPLATAGGAFDGIQIRTGFCSWRGRERDAVFFFIIAGSRNVQSGLMADQAGVLLPELLVILAAVDGMKQFMIQRGSQRADVRFVFEQGMADADDKAFRRFSALAVPAPGAGIDFCADGRVIGNRKRIEH